MSCMFMHLWSRKKNLKFRFCGEKSHKAVLLQEIKCCTWHKRGWQDLTYLKQNWCITLYSYYHHTHFFFLFTFFLSGFIVRRMFLWSLPRHPCGSWAMTPEQEKPAGFSQYRLRFIEPELVSIFGELVKYNCVILYKAVPGWQRPEKLHYSTFYWGMKKKKNKEKKEKEKRGHSRGDE